MLVSVLKLVVNASGCIESESVSPELKEWENSKEPVRDGETNCEMVRLSTSSVWHIS